MDQTEAAGRMQLGPEEVTDGFVREAMRKDSEQSPIAHRYDELERAIEEMGVLIDRLHSRIAPVLGPDLAEANPENPAPDQPQESDIATALHSRTRELRRYARALRSLTDRVEL